jgi:hypothetical protein
MTALLAFELFNYSTTDFALRDLLGDLSFMGIRWATILSIAFCGIDFAGIARLFTPEEGGNEPKEVWYLFGAWMLAAVMNAMLTWWGVSIALLQHQSLGNAVVAQETLLRAVPIFVAVLVWLTRVLIIGSFSIAGDRLFSQAEVRPPQVQRKGQPQLKPRYNQALGTGRKSAYKPKKPAPIAAKGQTTRAASRTFSPAPKPPPSDPEQYSPDFNYQPFYSASGNSPGTYSESGKSNSSRKPIMKKF